MLQRRTPLRSVSVKKAEKKRMGVSDLKASGLVSKASEFASKPRKALKPRSPKNKGGQAALFKWIWENRDQCCEVCKATILQPAAWNFSHLLPKGTYPDFKLDERNVILKCKLHHDDWHRFGPRLLKSIPMWLKVCAKYEQLRREANGIEP